MIIGRVATAFVEVLARPASRRLCRHLFANECDAVYDYGTLEKRRFPSGFQTPETLALAVSAC